MDEMGLVKYFVCGGVGGFCTVLVGHPLDTIKIRLQTMPVPKPGEFPLYSGTLDCFKKILKYEGFFGLYKGMGAPLLGVCLIFASTFMSYGLGKQLVSSLESQHPHLYYFTGGAFSGVFTTVIVAPVERIKSLLQIQQGPNAVKLYEGSLDCAKKLYRQGGFTNLYRGYGATLIRDIPSNGMYFLTYETIKKYVTNNGSKVPSQLEILFTGGAAGVNCWLIAMPPDVLKSRIQTAPQGMYRNGIRDVFKELIKTEGIAALYKGITAVLSRAFLANAACFLGFELCKQFIGYIVPKK